LFIWEDNYQNFGSFWHIIVDQATIIIVAINDHGIFVLVTKKYPIFGLHRLVLIIIVTGINYKYFPTLFPI
jgi:hypothetical protein